MKGCRKITTKTILLSTTTAAAFAATAALAGTDIAVDADASLGETSVQAVAEASTDIDAALDSNAQAGGEATVMASDGDAATQGAGDRDMMIAGSGNIMQAHPLKGMTVDEVVGMWVYGETGEAVGEIDYVIRAGVGFEAVIGVGGILGLGEYTVALPLERFEKTEDGVALRIAALTEAELRAMPEIDESTLDALEGDVVLN